MNKYLEYGFLDEESWNFPKIVNLNVFRGTCPCQCIHCPVGQVLPEDRQRRFSGSHASLFLYEKVVNEISASCSKSLLRIHSVGEPLLWSFLLPAIRYSKSMNVKTWIFTSAVTKDREILENLCKNIDIIEVSVNSISAEDYIATKGIDAFELVKENILFMSHYIQENNLNTRLLCSRVQTDNPTSDQDFIEYWNRTRALQDTFVRSYHNYNGLLACNASEPTMQPCLVHWARFNIDTTGNAVICFNELFKESISDSIILGNVLSESITDIWKSDKLNQIRQSQLQRKPLYEGDIPCWSCKTCQPYPPHKHTSEYQLKYLIN